LNDFGPGAQRALTGQDGDFATRIEQGRGLAKPVWTV
jgi:hypothetical protein